MTPRTRRITSMFWRVMVPLGGFLQQLDEGILLRRLLLHLVGKLGFDTLTTKLRCSRVSTKGLDAFVGVRNIPSTLQPESAPPLHSKSRYRGLDASRYIRTGRRAR
jgi:hypothetical protein